MSENVGMIFFRCYMCLDLTSFEQPKQKFIRNPFHIQDTVSFSIPSQHLHLHFHGTHLMFHLQHRCGMNFLSFEPVTTNNKTLSRSCDGIHQRYVGKFAIARECFIFAKLTEPEDKKKRLPYYRSSPIIKLGEFSFLGVIAAF